MPLSKQHFLNFSAIYDMEICWKFWRSWRAEFRNCNKENDSTFARLRMMRERIRLVISSLPLASFEIEK
jgi:hypothetical protein